MTKNVVIITPGFAANENDSACIPFLQMLVNELGNFPEIKVQIITLQYPYENKSYSYNGFKVHALGGKNKKGSARLSNWFKSYKLLKKLNKEAKIDVILSCWATECAVIASRFAKFNTCKHICWIIGQDSKADNKYVKYILKNTVFVCKTPFIKSFFKKNHGFEPQFIIPSGINLKMLPPIDLKNKTIDLIGVGSLISLKRFDWFLELTNDLEKKGITINCILIGDGPEKNNLENKLKKYGLEDRFKLLGNLSHTNVIQYMAKSKILIHPSSFEGLATVTLEALYAGCHVITHCRPFEKENKQMHYVNNYDELLKTAEELLLIKDLPFESQTDYTTERTAKEFVKLFL